MKKLILSAAVVFASLSIYATTSLPSVEEKTEVTAQNEYTEVSADVVPAAVKTALEKAYVNDKKEYKLEISVKDQKATAFSDVNGNWLKI